MTNYVVTTAVNGTFEVPDDLINSAQTSLNLIGRGVTNYGQSIAQNEINLLSNFAGPTAPMKPLLGQLWFNSSNQTLQLYTSTGTWSQMAAQSTLGNYALASDLSAVDAALVTLASNAAMRTDLANYVTANELYHPTSSSRIVPYQSGGLGLNTIGNPNQVLSVNAAGTGYTFASMSSFYQRPFVLAPASVTLTPAQLGSFIRATASGITITLTFAAQSLQGASFVISMPLTSGTVTIKAAGTDLIANTSGTKVATITLSANEEIEIVSDGATSWGISSYSRITAPTQPVTDNSTNIATTAFVNNYMTSGTLSPTFGTVSATRFLANEGVGVAGTEFNFGYSFTGDGDHDTGMFSPSDGNVHLYANGVDVIGITNTTIAMNQPTTIYSSLNVTGAATATTPTAGDSSTKVATTAFVTTALANKLPFTPVQQGGGASQNPNKVYLGWDGARLRCQIDSTDLGGLITSSELTTNVTNLQNNINTKAAASQPYAYTGINQSVSFWDITANGTLYSAHDVWAFVSDERLKENIRQISNPLEMIHELSGVLYNFNALAKQLAGIDTEREHMGLLAGQVAKVAPQLVGPAPFDLDKKTGKSISGKNYQTVQYDKAVPLLIEGIKALDTKVELMMDMLKRWTGDAK